MFLDLVIAQWRDDPFRRVANERGATADERGCTMSARVLAFTAVFVFWLKEGRPDVAAVALLHALLALGVRSMIRRRRSFFVEHREVIISLLQLQHVWTVMYIVANGSDAPYNMHQGSRLRLLISQLIGAPMWMVAYSLNTRLLVSWNAWLLPTLALLPLKMGPRVCGRLLESPGVEEPLAGLYRALDLLHMPCSPDAALRSVALATAPPGPMQACLANNAWSMVLFTVVVPLCIMYASERRERRHVHAEACAAAHAVALATGATEEEAGAAARLAAGPPPPAAPTFPMSRYWVVDVYVLSCMVWGLCTAVFVPT